MISLTENFIHNTRLFSAATEQSWANAVSNDKQRFMQKLNVGYPIQKNPLHLTANNGHF